MARFYKYLISGLMLLMVDACAEPLLIGANAKNLDKDFRLLVIEPDKIEMLVKNKQCLVLRRNSLGDFLFVTNATVESVITFQKLGLNSGLFLDSIPVLFKRSTIIRRPGWFEVSEADTKQREGFDNFLIESGDIIVFSPRQ